MQHTRLLLGLASIAATIVAAACGSSTAPGNGNPGGGHALVIDANPDLVFKPTPDTIAAGDTVQFRWHSVPHNVVWDATPADVANIGSGGTGYTSGDSSRVLSVPGTYAYHCDIHDGMTGVIVVQ
jgi:plastocyanin